MKQTRAMPSIAPNGLPRLNALPKRVYRWLGLGLLLAIGVTVGVALHWDERLYFHLTHAAPVAGAETTDRWLPDYRVLIEAKSVAGITRNLSAITYASRCAASATSRGWPTWAAAASRCPTSAASS